MASTLHQPVLVEAVIGMMAVKPQGVYLDATLGGGGYSFAALVAGAGRVIGLDWDAAALKRSTQRLAGYGDRFTGLRFGFQDAREALASIGLERVDGVMADLGLSSDQLADEGRGFSFNSDGPLDMRMDTRRETTAADLINDLSERELREMLWRLGEEKQSSRIARAVVAARAEERITTARQLADIISRAKTAPPRGRPVRIHPATKSFQALRMAVNGELDNLDRLLDDLPGLLRPGGRAVVVSFHSLEDRRVKRSFRAGAKGCQCPPRRPCVCGIKPVYRDLTSRPVSPSDEEAEHNPRARSARLRAVERIQQ